MVPSGYQSQLPAVPAPTRLSPGAAPYDTNELRGVVAALGGLPVGGERPHRRVQGARRPPVYVPSPPYGPA